MKRSVTLAQFLLAPLILFAQSNQRLSVFLDCSNTRCDRQFIMTELSVIDYSMDRIASDVHILLTSQRSGSDGREYQIIMYGQRNFGHIRDTLNFAVQPMATDVERREAIVNYLKLGLVPFIISNSQQELIAIDYTEKEELSTENATEDPWNYWVFRVGGNGRVNLDQNYTNTRIGGNFRASRVTDKKKFFVIAWGQKNKSTYTYEEDGVTEKTIVNNNDYGFRNFFVWSLGEKWAYGYTIGFNSDSFSNLESQYYVSPSIEYNFFPYKDVNNKLLTLRYGVGFGRNNYQDTTIYNKINEGITAQYLSLASEFNQKFGVIEIGMKYQHFYHDLGLNNLSFDAQFEIRITGNLSVDIYLYGALVHDQIYLARGDASAEDVLTRVRELESSFEFNTWFGINYRFGSRINNFVNPRFGSRGI